MFPAALQDLILHQTVELLHQELTPSAEAASNPSSSFSPRVSGDDSRCSSLLHGFSVLFGVVARIRYDPFRLQASDESREEWGVIIDSMQVARGISNVAKKECKEIDLLIELCTSRTGVSTPRQVVKLAQNIQSMSNVTFQGLMIYPSAPEFAPFIRSTLKALKSENLPVPLVCGGKSIYALKTHEIESSINELHLGTYVFYDYNYVTNGVVPLENCAAYILTTLVSRPKKEICIVDAGSKAFSWAYPQTHPEFKMRFGYVKEYPEGIIYTLAEEHGYMNINRLPKVPSLGEKLTVIPNSINDTVNMHNQMFAIQNEKVEAVWSIAARGHMQ